MEHKILELIATDRIELPLSSLDQKLRRAKSASAKHIAEKLSGEHYFGERVFAYTQEEDKERARGMKEAVAEFTAEFPKYGAILVGKIAEKRTLSEKHLYFGVNVGCRITAEDYLGVMQNMGLSESTARSLYPELMDVSRKLAKARDEERTIIVGKYDQE